jgi:hypothetical protein
MAPNRIDVHHHFVTDFYANGKASFPAEDARLILGISCESGRR